MTTTTTRHQTSILPFILLLSTLLFIIRTASSSSSTQVIKEEDACHIDADHYITNQYPPIDNSYALSHNKSVYFGFRVPSDWIESIVTPTTTTTIVDSIPTVLFRIEYDVVQCSRVDNDNNRTLVNVQPVLSLGAIKMNHHNDSSMNHDDYNSRGEASCSVDWLRTVYNMTTSYRDMSHDIYVQYIALYPSDMIHYGRLGVNEFVFALEQSNCDAANFNIHASYVQDVDLNSQALRVSVFPGMRQYFKYSVDQSVGANKLLLGSVQNSAPYTPSTMHMRMNDYPSGDANDQVFVFNSIAVSPLPLNSVFYFYIEFDLTEDNAHNYVQEMIQINIIFSKGRLCEHGCGLSGSCNFTTGECTCRSDLGFYGDDCSITGCTEGSPCTVSDTAKGSTRCNGPDWANSVCVIESCLRPLHMVDLVKNRCVRTYPDSMFFSLVAASAVAAAIFGFSLGLGVCRLCSKRFQRRHYHYLR